MTLQGKHGVALKAKGSRAYKFTQYCTVKYKPMSLRKNTPLNLACVETGGLY